MSHRSRTRSLFLVAAIVASTPTSAQDGYKLSSITVSSGEDPISSGLTGVVRLTSERNRLLEFTIQQELAWVVWGPTFNLGKAKAFVAGSIGHHQGAPWAGPYVSLSLPVARHVTLSTYSWPAIYGWEPTDWQTENDGVRNPESVLLTYVGNVQVDVGPIGLVYSWQNFLDDPGNPLPGVVYTTRVRTDTTISGSATWNSNTRKWMFYAGLTWKRD